MAIVFRPTHTCGTLRAQLALYLELPTANSNISHTSFSATAVIGVAEFWIRHMFKQVTSRRANSFSYARESIVVHHDINTGSLMHSTMCSARCGRKEEEGSDVDCGERRLEGGGEGFDLEDSVKHSDYPVLFEYSPEIYQKCSSEFTTQEILH